VTKSDFQLRFWGVRGSIPCSGHDILKYGGNTSCIEVRCGDRLIILDGGTGLRELGISLGEEAIDADILLSHTHYDHILGLPFFAPVYAPQNRFRMWAGRGDHGKSLDQVLRTLMQSPLFPIPVEAFGADMSYLDFDAGEALDMGDGILIRTAPLNHPNGATGYRIEYGGRAVAYVTDTEHTPGTLDQNIVDLVRGADAMIYDSTYGDAEFPKYQGWGHSTWEEGVRLCQSADVGKLYIFHHDPSHDDTFLDGVGVEAEKLFAGACMAQEGMTVTF
jgi:phosphoribosyl 1,2-cyclic phosphodiesterase